MATPAVGDTDPTVMALLDYALQQHAGAECTAATMMALLEKGLMECEGAECDTRGCVEAKEVLARAAISDMLRAAKLEDGVRHAKTMTNQDMKRALKLRIEAQTHLQEAAAAEHAAEEANTAEEEATKARLQSRQKAEASKQAAASVVVEMKRVAHRAQCHQQVIWTFSDWTLSITNGFATRPRHFTGPRPDGEQAPRGGKQHRTEGPDRRTY
jgi:hypothetical protein